MIDNYYAQFANYEAKVQSGSLLPHVSANN